MELHSASLVLSLTIFCITFAMVDVKPSSASDVMNRINHLENTLTTLSRQLMMQQFYVEEQTRSSGSSGLKRVRTGTQGTRPYYSASHVGGSIASIHDHANNIRTIGMGEMVVVLNGIEFRTRHNDYRMKMKSLTSTEYGATEDIPFPEVPPAVIQHLSVADQAIELREWFKAWRDQDYSVRDYRPYFKPVLCYLEGSWTHSDQNSIDEPFDSDRHHLDASSWHDLQDKIRFTSYSGSKDGLENLAYLPTTIMELINGTDPVLAQWNFNILCHPLSQDLPLSRLRVVDDLKTRMAKGGATLEEYEASRAARYQLATFDDDYWREGGRKWALLDQLMEEIPGKDNYPGSINDTLFGDVVFQYNRQAEEEVLNAAYYHRWYKVEHAGAMGLKYRHRGFADENMFVAQTTQPKVAGLHIDQCRRRKKDCVRWNQKWSYAIPLEIIYMTPLSAWNPFDIPYRGDASTTEGKSIYDGPYGKRNGQDDPDKAFNGTNSKYYYQTPRDFFDNEFETDPADTTRDSTHVLDGQGQVREVRASGHRIFLPDIPDVGMLRQRYPIMPIHGEGDGVWKELDALMDIVLQPRKYQHMLRERSTTDDGSDDDKNNDESNNENGTVLNGDQGKTLLEFTTQAATPEWGSHRHHFTVTQEEHDTLEDGGVVYNIITEEADGHSHNLTLIRKGKNRYLMRECDGRMRCFDGHGRRVYPV